MASAGQTIENPLSGERITFRETAADTGGELLADRPRAPPGGRVPGGLHVHPEQEECFEVMRGLMRFRKRREKIVAGPGEAVVVPAGVPHDFANAGDETALVRVEVRPALQMERLFETAVALARDGRALRNGKFYVVPVEEVGVSKTYLRVDPVRNGQSHGVRWAEDYELPG
jgi:quercetin dioxygenase-like cupin family protein